MISLGNVELGRVPRVVLGVDGSLPVLNEAHSAGIDILEVRVDRFDRLEASSVLAEIKAIRRHGLPLIGTIRSHEERGSTKISNAKRLKLYRDIVPLVDAVDIELNATSILGEVIELARENHALALVSYHDFDQTPADAELGKVIERAGKAGADIIKIATLAKQGDDVVRLFNLTARNREKNLVTVAMGASGSISRLVFPIAGSLMTYTSVSPSDGQIPAQELIDHLRLYYPTYNEELINRLALLEYA